MLGSNLGDRMAYLKNAREMIREGVGEITDSSSIYETEPWGFRHEIDFLNQCIVVETPLSGKEVLEKIQAIEKALGRKDVALHYAARVIDVDILFFNDEVIDEDGLTVPHRSLHLRRFVLVPLDEIAPGHIHPVLRQTASAMLYHCEDHSSVRKFSDR